MWNPYLQKDIALLKDVQSFAKGLLQTVELELPRITEPVQHTNIETVTVNIETYGLIIIYHKFKLLDKTTRMYHGMLHRL